MAKLYLRKCAYIFDWSNSTYFYGTKAEHAHKIAVNNALKAFYDNEETRNNALECEQDENGNYYIEICGERHRLNDLQIAKTDNDNDTINHRKEINRDEILKECPHFEEFCNSDIYSKKFRTLHFEFFTGPDDLGYIRVNFKGQSEQFVIDSRTNCLMTSGETGKHKPISRQLIESRLNIKSANSKKEFREVIDALLK